MVGTAGIDQRLIFAGVNQIFLSRGRGIGRVLLAVIHNRKMRFKPFFVKFKLCQILAVSLQIISISNLNLVTVAAVVTLPIFDGRLFGFFHAIGPIIGIG